MSIPHDPWQNRTRGPAADHRSTDPTVAIPREPEDVDELLAESLRAQNEQEFAWKEPQRRPRWFERAEMEQESSSEQTVAASDAAPPSPTHSARGSRRGRSGRRAAENGQERGPRVGGVVYAAAALALALWVLAGVVLGIHVPALVVALGICTLAGLALVVAGLRPKPGHRI